jgi:chromosome segregation ATPase
MPALDATPAPRPPRPQPPATWRVRSVTCRAFKCYGAAPTAYSFDSSLVTCILGPNGSGKSALLEALCFALGAPAPALRVGVLRDVVSTESESQVRRAE